MNIDTQVNNNYIYLFHTDELFILPTIPESISDNLGSTFASTTALGRTAPIYSYSNSGPRQVSIDLTFHRDMMNDFNLNNSYVRINDANSNIISSITDDYADILIKKLQAIALPRYNSDGSAIIPPQVAVRFGNDIFIKGVVTSGININYKLPLLSNGKYAIVSINFTVSEIIPYNADNVGQLGSFRGLTNNIASKIKNS